MTEYFEAVIIGSRFGGSVMTCRLAKAGLRVCLLERGRAYPPNSFPRTPYDPGKNFRDPSNGLYNVRSFKDSGAVARFGRLLRGKLWGRFCPRGTDLGAVLAK